MRGSDGGWAAATAAERQRRRWSGSDGGVAAPAAERQKQWQWRSSRSSDGGWASATAADLVGKVWISREPHIVPIPTYVGPRNLNNDLQDGSIRSPTQIVKRLFWVVVRDFTDKEKLRRYFAEGWLHEWPATRGIPVQHRNTTGNPDWLFRGRLKGKQELTYWPFIGRLQVKQQLNLWSDIGIKFSFYQDKYIPS